VVLLGPGGSEGAGGAPFAVPGLVLRCPGVLALSWCPGWCWRFGRVRPVRAVRRM
jgi:hypothetical protein